MKYKVVTVSGGALTSEKKMVEKLEAEVNQMIADGWRPVGGFSATATGSSNGISFVFQAMTKDD